MKRYFFIEELIPMFVKVVLLVAIIAFGIIQLLQGDYQKDYYPDPRLITIELENQIVDYLAYERFVLDYPELTGRGEVNKGRDDDIKVLSPTPYQIGAGF